MAAKGDTRRLIQLAEQYLGTPYKWGGSSPQTGFDCSGFVQWLYGQQGINLPRTTYQQVNAGTAVPRNQLRPGDILFFEPSKSGPGHEGLYIGNGKFIEAPHTGATIRVSSLAGRSDYVAARRIIASPSPSLAQVVNTTPKTLAPPPAVPAPSSDDQNPIGQADYTIDPSHLTTLWQTVAAQGTVSPETQQLVQNAAIVGGANAAGLPNS